MTTYKVYKSFVPKLYRVFLFIEMLLILFLDVIVSFGVSYEVSGITGIAIVSVTTLIIHMMLELIADFFPFSGFCSPHIGSLEFIKCSPSGKNYIYKTVLCDLVLKALRLALVASLPFMIRLTVCDDVLTSILGAVSSLMTAITGMVLASVFVRRFSVNFQFHMLFVYVGLIIIGLLYVPYFIVWAVAKSPVILSVYTLVTIIAAGAVIYVYLSNMLNIYGKWFTDKQ